MDQGNGQVNPQQGWQQPGPLTLAGWGAVVIGIGFVLTLVGLFALPWAFDLSFLQVGASSSGSGGSFSVGIANAYVHYLGFLAVACQPLATLPWALGALRTPKSARTFSGIRRKQLTNSSFGWYRTVFTGRSTVMLVIHLIGFLCICDGDLSQLGVLQAGAWVLLAGSVIAIAGAAIGPRKGPSLPA